MKRRDFVNAVARLCEAVATCAISEEKLELAAYLGDPAAGVVIRTRPVDDEGEFKLRRRNGPNPTAAGAPNYVTLVSSLGGSVTCPIEIDD